MTIKREMIKEDEAIGSWLSAAMEDPKVCTAMKDDIDKWFDTFVFHREEIETMIKNKTKVRILTGEYEEFKAVILGCTDTHVYLNIDTIFCHVLYYHNKIGLVR